MGFRNGLTGVIAAFIVSLLPAYAHVELEQYLQQRVTVAVTPVNIDITIEFLFTSPVSLAERTRIDTNGDGTLSQDERQAYLEAIAERAEQGLSLRVDGERCPLTPLYDAELDFFDSKEIEAHPHVLRLAYFARTPKSFDQGSTLTLDSRLWVDAPILVAASIRGKDGIELSAAPNPGLQRASGIAKSIRVVEAKCVSIEEVKTQARAPVPHVPTRYSVPGSPLAILGLWIDFGGLSGNQIFSVARVAQPGHSEAPISQYGRSIRQ